MTLDLSAPRPSAGADWSAVPDRPGVYVVYGGDEALYVGMAGRNGRGSLRRRLQAHARGHVVNTFAQYLFLARVQFVPDEPITHPRDASRACRAYVRERGSFAFRATADGADARLAERALKATLRPALNP
jgi:hypothetical protein